MAPFLPRLEQGHPYKKRNELFLASLAVRVSMHWGDQKTLKLLERREYLKGENPALATAAASSFYVDLYDKKATCQCQGPQHQSGSRFFSRVLMLDLSCSTKKYILRLSHKP